MQPGISEEKHRSDFSLVLEKAREMMDALRATRVYKDYQKDLDRVKENQDTYHRMNELKRRNLTLCESEEGYHERWKNLCLEYEDILMEPAVMSFLTSEEQMNKMLRGIYDCIAGEARMDLSYMD